MAGGCGFVWLWVSEVSILYCRWWWGGGGKLWLCVVLGDFFQLRRWAGLGGFSLGYFRIAWGLIVMRADERWWFDLVVFIVLTGSGRESGGWVCMLLSY